MPKQGQNKEKEPFPSSKLDFGWEGIVIAIQDKSKRRDQDVIKDSSREMRILYALHTYYIKV